MITSSRNQRIHFIGIGGSGMGGIAEVLFNLKFKVSGSDIRDNYTTKRLSDMGINISIGHKAENINDCQIVVISSAISQNNIEVTIAKQNHIPIIPRAEMLGEIMRFRYGIAISGTHGKTTTTSLISHILSEANLDPTFIIGGILKTTGTNAKLGKSKYLIAEADESDCSFLNLQPMLSVITNIDADHMDTYDNDIKKLEDAFLQFISNLPFYGLCVLCSDDAGVLNILSRVSRPFVCYGFSSNADIRAIGILQTQSKMNFTLLDNIREQKHQIEINLIGRHNILNALAAISIALELNVDIKDIQSALASFPGIGRRFENYGEINIKDKKVQLFDDYGHHPNELKNMFKALEKSFPNNRLVIIFQAHRYSRTKNLFNDFVEVLSTVDNLILLEIYSANEKPIKNISASQLAKSINEKNNTDVKVSNLENILDLLATMVSDGDVILTIGAGDVGSLPAKIVEKWQ